MESLIENVFANVIAGGIIIVLGMLPRWLSARMVRVPTWLRVMFFWITGLVWIGVNVANAIGRHVRPELLFAVTSVIVWLVVYRHLSQFWDVGIISVDKTTASGLSYAKALELCQNELRFLGIGASKLTRDRGAFEAAITRCNRQTTPIKFLLCKPTAGFLEKAAQQAGRPKDAYSEQVGESLRVIRELQNNRKLNVEVRFYPEKAVPLFRLMFVDDSLCLASYYVFGEGDGSQLPQVHVMRPSGRRDVESLYYAFNTYFDKLWEESEVWDFQEIR